MDGVRHPRLRRPPRPLPHRQPRPGAFGPPELDPRRRRHRAGRPRAHVGRAPARPASPARAGGSARSRRPRASPARTSRSRSRRSAKRRSPRSVRTRDADRPGWRHRQALDGIEAQVQAMQMDGPAAVGVVTGNVVLWPRPISVVVNKERFAALPAEQQAALRDAIGASTDTMIDDLRLGDEQVVDSRLSQRRAVHRGVPGRRRRAPRRGRAGVRQPAVRRRDEHRHRRDHRAPHRCRRQPRLSCRCDEAGGARGRGHRHRRHLVGLPHPGGHHRRGRAPGRGADQRRLHDDDVRSRDVPRGGRRVGRPGRGRLPARRTTTSWSSSGPTASCSSSPGACSRTSCRSACLPRRRRSPRRRSAPCRGCDRRARRRRPDARRATGARE